MATAQAQGRRIPNEEAERARNGAEPAERTRIPHDLEVERALLGAMLVDPRAIDTARATVSPADFYSPNHGTIYAAIVELAEERAGGRVDATEVYAHLARQAEKTGRPPDVLVADLAALLPNAPGYYGAGKLADQLADLRRRRELIAVAAGIATAARTGSTGDVDDARLTLEHLERDRVLAGSPYGDVAKALAGGTDEAAPIYGIRSDGKALFYDAALNYIFGEPGKGKSWLAFLVAAEVMRDGGTVVIADYEDTLAGVVGRLRALSVADDVLVRRLHYITDPAGRPLPDLRRLSLEPKPDLVILDGIAAALAANELDENSAADVNTFLDAWLIPVARHGAAAIGVDHVTKSKDQRGLWPRGSGAKRARIDGAAYFVEPGAEGLFTRSNDGALRAVLAKDRRGIVGQEGALIASLKVRHNEEADALGILVTYLDPPATMADLVEGGDLEDPAVNLKTAEGILAVLEELAGTGPKSRNELRAELAGRLGIKASNEKIAAATAYLTKRNLVERHRTGRKDGIILVPEQRRLRLVTDDGDPGPQEP